MFLFKRTLIYTTCIGLLMLSFLFSPKPTQVYGPQKYCPVNYIELGKNTGFLFNCDAIEFIGISVSPQLLLTEKFSRQSRPLYIVAGSILGNIIYFLDRPWHDLINKKTASYFKGQLAPEKASLYLSHYAGLVLLNLIILVISLYLFEFLILYYTGTWQNGSLTRVAFWILLISSQVTKEFFWAPHQQLFSLLLPLLAIRFFIIIDNAPYDFKKFACMGLFGGSLLLFYGSFILLLPSLLFPLIYSSLKSKRSQMPSKLKAMMVLLIFYFLPFFIWILILYSNGTSFYSRETQVFREFVWIWDTALNSNWPEFSDRFIGYLSTFGSLIVPLLLFGYAVIVHKANDLKSTPIPKLKKEHLPTVFIFVTGLILLFYFLMGYYTDRLTYTCAPALICLSAILINSQRLNITYKLSLLIFSVSWHIYLIIFEMPHFSERFYY